MRRAIFQRRSVRRPGAHPRDAPAVLEQLGHDRFLPDLRSLFARVVQQQLIEFRAQYLPGLRHRLAVVAVEKIKRLAGTARGRDKLHAVFLDKRRTPHLLDQPQPLQRLEGERQQRFPYVVARKFLPLQNQRAMPVLRQYGGGGRTRRVRRR